MQPLSVTNEMIHIPQWLLEFPETKYTRFWSLTITTRRPTNLRMYLSETRAGQMEAMSGQLFNSITILDSWQQSPRHQYWKVSKVNSTCVSSKPVMDSEFIPTATLKCVLS